MENVKMKTIAEINLKIMEPINETFRDDNFIQLRVFLFCNCLSYFAMLHAWGAFPLKSIFHSHKSLFCPRAWISMKNKAG